MASLLLKNVKRFFTKFRVVEVNSITFILVWNMPAVPGGKWHWGLLNLKISQPKKGTNTKNFSAEELEALGNHAPHLSLRGLMVWSMSVACAGYFLAAGYLYQRLESRYPKIELSYLDVALPTRWPDLNYKRGKALITQGREFLAARKSSQGFSLMRQGLARNPEDFSARLDIAKVYTGIRLLPQGIKLLKEGFKYGYPGRQYLETLFGLLSATDQPDALLDAVQTARSKFLNLAESVRSPSDQRFLDESLANALRDSGHIDEAFRHVCSVFPEQDVYRLKFLTKLNIKSNPRESARLAELWAKEEPSNYEPLNFLALALRYVGDFDGMDAAIERLKKLNPVEPDGLLFQVLQYHEIGRRQDSRVAMERLLFRYGGELDFYTYVCNSLLETGYIEGLDIVEADLRERGLSLHPVLWARVKNAAKGNNWNELQGYIEKLRTTSGPNLKRDEIAYLETMSRLSAACLDGGSGTQRSLVETVGDNPGSLVLFNRLLSALLEAGRHQTARQILVLAEGPYPDSRTIREFSLKIDTALRAVPTTEPALALSASSAGTWDDFRERFSTLLKESPTKASNLLSDIRRAQPDWLEKHRTEIEVLELPLRAREDNPLLLQMLVRGVLSRNSLSIEKILTLARGIYPDYPINARLILKETLRAHSENEDALALQRIWEPATTDSPTTSQTAQP